MSMRAQALEWRRNPRRCDGPRPSTLAKAPREEIMYFDGDGNLNAVRWNDWKVNFAGINGNIVMDPRSVTGWPLIVNLRADPYERMPFESMMYMRWYADNIWLFVPVGGKLKEFVGSIQSYPFQEGAGMNPSGINYRSLKAAGALQRLQEIESLRPPHD